MAMTPTAPSDESITDIWKKVGTINFTFHHGRRKRGNEEDVSQGSIKFRTYDRTVVANQGCLHDTHVSELLILPDYWNNICLQPYEHVPVRSIPLKPPPTALIAVFLPENQIRCIFICFGATWNDLVLIQHFGDFLTPPTNRLNRFTPTASRTWVDTEIQLDCITCITRFHQNIRKVVNRICVKYFSDRVWRYFVMQILCFFLFLTHIFLREESIFKNQFHL